MTWTPKPGDKVTSPLLVGEWEVESADYPVATSVWGVDSDGRGVRVHVHPDNLTPVVPPLPPEPKYGEVVWAQDRYWHRSYDNEDRDGIWVTMKHAPAIGWFDDDAKWSDIAADAVPVVPATEVAAWLRDYYGYDGMAAAAIAKFGWDKP